MQPAPATPADAPSRILLTEDNATIRLITTRMLEGMGHAVSVAEDGEAAVHAVRAEAFDLVLMDLMMPRMDGLAATRAIRSLSGQRMPIIGLSANAAPEDQRACLDAGMDGFATKPISPAALRATIAAALRRPV